MYFSQIQIFRSSGASKFFWIWFYKHLVPPGLKTQGESRDSSDSLTLQSTRDEAAADSPFVIVLNQEHNNFVNLTDDVEISSRTYSCRDVRVAPVCWGPGECTARAIAASATDWICERLCRSCR